MNILSWYICKTYLKYWTVTLLALILLVLIGNLFGKIDDVFSSRASFLEFIDDTIRSLPLILDLLLPMTVLLATVFTFNSLGRTSELVAMRSVGMGIARQLRPIVFALVFIAALDYFNQNYLYRWLGNEYATLPVKTSAQSQWRTQRDTIYYIASIDSVRRRLAGVRIFQWAEQPFRLTGIDTIRLVRQPSDHLWVLDEVVHWEKLASSWRLEVQPQLKLAGEEFPDMFLPEDFNAHHLPIFDLSRKIRQLESQGRRVELFHLEWYQKTAAMFAPFILVWFGTPLSQAYFRKGRASGEIMISILGGLLFLIATEILFTLGKGGFLRPVVSAWAVNVAFLIVGGVMMWRTR